MPAGVQGFDGGIDACVVDQVVRIFGRIVELLHRDRHGCFSAVVLEITEGVARTAKLDHVGNIVLRVPHNGSSARINIEESDRFFGILEILQIFHNTCLICKESAASSSLSSMAP